MSQKNVFVLETLQLTREIRIEYIAIINDPNVVVKEKEDLPDDGVGYYVQAFGDGHSHIAVSILDISSSEIVASAEDFVRFKDSVNK